MFSIGGVALDNPTAGWWLEERTRTIADATRELSVMTQQGIDGGLPLVGRYTPRVWPLTLRVGRDAFSTLLTLFTSRSTLRYTGDDTTQVTFAYLGFSVVDEDYASDGTMLVQFNVRLDDPFFRSVATTTSTAVALSSASVTVGGLFSGLSAPVQDAIVRVRGGLDVLTVTDSSGSWWTFDTIASGNYIRFDSATGRVFATATDVWTGGTEVSGRADFGGPRDLFEITPAWTVSGDPAVRAGVLTVTTTARTGSPQIEVRGRGAFVV